MPLHAPYSVSREDRRKFAHEYDHLDTPMSFPQQKIQALENPTEHSLKVQRVFEALIANPDIANLYQYKYLPCRNVEYPCSMGDYCCYVHTQVYIDALTLYKQAQRKAIQTQASPAPRNTFVSISAASQRSTSVSSGPSSNSSVPSPSPVGGTSSVSSIVSTPVPSPSVINAPVLKTDQPQNYGPRFGMPPLVIIDDTVYRMRRDILFGINVNLRDVIHRA